jgi:EAL domain-containing protein (putative c-di-GMP-specific phosphodiesterase class I)/GGDEF domain-containing protein
MPKVLVWVSGSLGRGDIAPSEAPDDFRPDKVGPLSAPASPRIHSDLRSRCMFGRLQTKLSVLYGSMFAVLLLLLGAAGYVAISQNVERAIQSELVADGAVFDKVWALRSQQLEDGAKLLARDFGFRAAVATHDAETTDSALENLRQRLSLDTAFIVDLDAGLTGLDKAQLDSGPEALLEVLSHAPNANGVLMIGGHPHQAISVPIQAPQLIGWVVFAVKVDRRELSALEKMSSAQMQAGLLTRGTSRPWTLQAARSITTSDLGRLSSLADAAMNGEIEARRLSFASGPAVTLIRPLQSIDPGRQAALVLRYPLGAALEPYRPMLIAVVVLCAVSLVLLLIGSGLLARSVTRPLADLNEAARRLARGEDGHVTIASADEIGSLAESFNTMASEIGERERRITHLALHDAETGLPNRRALIQQLDTLTEARSGRIVVAGAIGLERFSFLRSAIGYPLAGVLMKELAARVSDRLPHLAPTRLSTGILGIAFEAEDLAEAEGVLAALVNVLDHPVRLGPTTVDVAVSAGLAVMHVHATDAAALVERANIALDQAIAAQCKTAVFNAVLYGDPASNLPLMSEMLDAIRAGELALNYQPKLDLRSGEICGVEALARWRHPVRGMLSPDLFVGMAEETGHIRALTDWALDQAIADQIRLRDAGSDLLMSVNISGRLMSDRDFASAAIARIGAAGARICFEITETAVIDNPEIALELISGYAAAGVPISIDDYGSGLSSLAYLKQIEAQELKIDKAFVLTLAEGRREALIVKSTVDLAHAMGLKVVAEGVETAESVALLRAMGCDVAQGYHIARPMAFDRLVAFLDGHKADMQASAVEATSATRRRPPRAV